MVDPQSWAPTDHRVVNFERAQAYPEHTGARLKVVTARSRVAVRSECSRSSYDGVNDYADMVQTNWDNYNSATHET